MAHDSTSHASHDAHDTESHDAQTSESQSSPASSKKVWIITSIVIAVLLIGAGFAYWSLVSSTTVKAQVHVESGTVLLNGDTITGMAKAGINDIIETTDGLATVFLYESVVVHLEKNTKITIADLAQEHPKITVEKGSTWNTFTKLLGVNGFTAQSSNSVASVRGTSFGFSDGWLMVGEGTVQFKWKDQTWDVVSGDMMEMNGTTPIKRKMTSADWDKVKGHVDRTMDEMSVLRWQEVEKHGTLKSLVASQQQWSDEDMQQKLKELDTNNEDIEQLKKKAPMQVDSVDKVADLTKAIRAMNKEKQRMDGQGSADQKDPSDGQPN